MGNLWSLNPADWFSDEDRGAGVKAVADPYGGVRKAYLDWLTPEIGKARETYPGQLVAPLSEQESKSFDFLRQYGEGGITRPGSTFQQGKAEISKTLTDQYNPATSPYYQAVKAEASKNLQDTQKGIANKAAGGGRYWAGARLGRQQEAASETERGLNTMLGLMSENERQRRLDVLPQAYQYGQAEAREPLEKASAFQNLGALPRQVEQMLNTANYQEWLSSQVDYPMQIAQMAQQTQQAPFYQQNTPSFIYEMLTGGMNKFAEGAGKAAGSAKGGS